MTQNELARFLHDKAGEYSMLKMKENYGNPPRWMDFDDCVPKVKARYKFVARSILKLFKV